MSAKFWILTTGLIAVATVILLIRNHDEGYRQYYHGQFSAAISGLQKKAEYGDAFAAYLLGKSFETGQGVQIDKEKAQLWFLKSARLGNLNGAVMYALSIHNRILAHQTYLWFSWPVKGPFTTELSKEHCIAHVKFLDMAARQGSYLAADLLGRYYANGECVSSSELESWYYFKLASAMDRSFGVRLEGKKTLSAKDQEILESRLAAPNRITTDAQVLAYFFSSLDKFW